MVENTKERTHSRSEREGGPGRVGPGWVGVTRMGEMAQSTGISQGHGPLCVGPGIRETTQQSQAGEWEV